MKKLLNWFDQRIFFLGIIILLVFIPLYPKFPLFNIPKTYVAIRFEDFLVAFMVGIFLIKIIRQKTQFFQNRLNRLFLVYFFVGGLSTLSAIFITKNVIPHLVVLHWMRHIEYMSLFFISVYSVKKVQNIKDSFSVLVLATIGVILYGLGQKFLGFPVVSTMNEEFSKGILLTLTEWARINSTFAGHYDLAAYLVLFLAFLFGAIFSYKRRLQKIFIVIVGVFSFYLLILTSSQIAFMAYLVSIVFILVISRKFRWILPVLLLSILGTFASRDLTDRYAATIRINRDLAVEAFDKSRLAWLSRLYVPTPIPTLTPTPTPAPVPVVAIKPTKKIVTPLSTPTEIIIPSGPKRYMTYESTSSADITALTAYRSTTIRLNVEWPRAIRAFLKNPLLGTGYSSITLATDNDYLRVLGETGLLGFVAIFLIFLQIIIEVIKYLAKNVSPPEKMLVIGFSGAILGFLINASFIDVFESSKVAYVFWIIVGLLVGLMKLNPTKADKLS
ncbi:hypothetical protein COT44_04735 [Candidatus Shapirobacteria bacterium CG08_land_8_20_14_0_20_39_18]|uniref:O-antigen ligase-related domain-containing protein n=1 Tax=Candidatus Shapirobacteria bacterium CG08_land_8_20_14_0_20_39_18 TaxID=1974883 RepID=A0A2M6XBX7_9BACT|nr:MAG: hypothetical protein COT44_04735 [Candidatus Shapirobacteria bacterium CG08_land_8_20_14_0_20_39_18]PIY65360.1 MAG: hypothetical protein COY91_03025 [Candidatus Shapirobacteria bacterium CG_4_10_14_0_8_um_filter_39_15]PJE68569.1 MAG: hypothetical protein COU94_01165 [Candidatus Shapirobacteria bacterium CG10_big_fil_rev_8_21_14_0_10_38_8]